MHMHAHTQGGLRCDYYQLACAGAGPGVALSYFSRSVGWWLLGTDTPMPMSGLSYFAHSKRRSTDLIDDLHGSPISRGLVVRLWNAMQCRSRDVYVHGRLQGCTGSLADCGLGDTGGLC